MKINYICDYCKTKWSDTDTYAVNMVGKKIKISADAKNGDKCPQCKKTDWIDLATISCHK